ncbi:MAG: glucosamine-6-phosphate deaminase [Spirochaetales bacterium]|nr:glucosamine-6-phosphate deaminase [Spirochaetales bacterium]
MKTRKYSELKVKIYPDRTQMGAGAATDAAECIRMLLNKKDEINCVFAAAPSQNDFLAALVSDKSIDWTRINAYHMDDYVGLKQGSPQSFSGFLNNAIFSKVPFKSVNLLNGEADPETEARRYDHLLRTHKTDIVLMGIGENGHIAFNDPGVADFHDEKFVKIATLDEVCRMQQVHDKCFATIDDVPKSAFTVTVPGLMAADYHFCIVPTKLKACAVKKMLEGPISEDCPASILKTRCNARLYLDLDSASLLN